MIDQKQNVDEYQRELKELRDTHKSLKGKVDWLTDEKMDRIQESLDNREAVEKERADIKKAQAAIDERLSTFEEKMKTAKSGEVEKEDKFVEERKAMRQYILKGDKALAPDTLKRLSTSTSAPSWGYTIDADQETMIRERVINMNPIREVADQITIGSTSVNIPVQTGDAAVDVRAEGVSRPESTDGTLVNRAITPVTYVSVQHITQELAEDSFVDIEGFLRKRFSKTFASKESEQFLNANSSAGNVGLLNTQTATTIPADNRLRTKITAGEGQYQVTTDLIFDLVHDTVHNQYAKNGTFLFNRPTLGQIRLLENTNGELVFNLGMSGIPGMAMEILGHKYKICDSMASYSKKTGATNTGKTLVIFGDFDEFCIADRTEISVLHDIYTQSPNGAIRVIARKRVGSTLIHPEAFGTIHTGT